MKFYANQNQLIEAFDEISETILARLTDGDGQAVNEDGRCVYRNEIGHRCAVGAVIDDDEYDEMMEGSGVHTLVQDIPRLRDFTSFLLYAQTLHDNDTNWDAPSGCLQEGAVKEFIHAASKYRSLLEWEGLNGGGLMGSMPAEQYMTREYLD